MKNSQVLVKAMKILSKDKESKIKEEIKSDIMAVVFVIDNTMIYLSEANENSKEYKALDFEFKKFISILEKLLQKYEES